MVVFGYDVPRPEECLCALLAYPRCSVFLFFSETRLVAKTTQNIIAKPLFVMRESGFDLLHDDIGLGSLSLPYNVLVRKYFGFPLDTLSQPVDVIQYEVCCAPSLQQGS